MQGRFPDWRKVVPNSFNAKIDMVVAPFYAAIRQAQIVTNEESRGVDFTFAKGTLKLNSQAADIGQRSSCRSPTTARRSRSRSTHATSPTS